MRMNSDIWVLKNDIDSRSRNCLPKAPLKKIIE